MRLFFYDILLQKGGMSLMGKEIYNIINDMAEVLNASQMQKLQEVLVNRLSENSTLDYLQTGNEVIKSEKHILMPRLKFI